MARTDRQKMDEDTLGAVCGQEIQMAIGNIGQTLSAQREAAMRYYLALPFGNEIDGRSQVVLTEVRDTIESQLPSLLKIFLAGDKICQVEPQMPEDEAAAKQATEYINYVLMRDNPGFRIFHNWMKDALLQKVGVVKYWWDERKNTTEEDYTGLTQTQFIEVATDEEVEVLEHTAYPDPNAAAPLTAAPGAGASPLSLATPPVIQPQMGQMPGAGAQPAAPPQPQISMLHDLKVRRTSKVGRTQIDGVPPEEFLISREAKTIQDARFVGHKREMTESELRQLGFDDEAIAKLPTETAVYWSVEATTRRALDDEQGTANIDSKDPAQRRVTVIEGYYRVDYDGDGIVELRQVWTGSAGTPVLRNEIWNGPTAPFAALCPVPVPHRFFGLSEADMVSDLQLIKSTVMRNFLDNIYLLNNQRYKLMMGSEDGINMDDFLTQRPGGGVRVRPGSDIIPLENAPLGDVAIAAMEYLDTVKENRSGVTRYNQGLDADSLNKTATGVTQVMSASMERQLLVARVFAETGVKDLCRGILQLECEHRAAPRTVRLVNQWVDVDPRQWAHLDEVTIDVGIGTGSKDQELMKRMQLLNIQKEFAMNGLTNIVGPQQLYNTAAKLTALIGDKTPDPYFIDPHNAPPPAPPPDPKQQAVQQQAQAKLQQIQMQAQSDQAQRQQDMQIAAQKAQQDRADQQHEMMVRDQEMRLQAHFEQQKQQQEMALERARFQMQMEHERLAAQLKLHIADVTAQQKMQHADQAARQSAAQQPKGEA